MHVYPTRALALLTRSSQLTDDEWFQIIDSRRALCGEMLKSRELPTLGKLDCLTREYSFRHNLEVDRPINICGSKFSLFTTGIFGMQPLDEVERVPGSGYQPGPDGIACPDGKLLIWGLTESSEWVVAEVAFVGRSGYKGRGYERAVTVDILDMELADMMARTKVKPRAVWEAMGEAIKAWENYRKNRYQYAANILRIAEAEDSALAALLENNKEG